MTEFLLDFFVLAQGGKVIFSHFSLLKCDDQLIGAYFHAINSLYNICFERDMQKVSMNDYRLHFTKIEPFFFIGLSPTSLKNKTATTNFESLAHSFYDEYFHKLPQHWESNVALFNDFNSNINKRKKEITLPS
ncbi:MAG: hypothetical protein KGD67_03690 [Candidatus Lokiarchaeota archaeon]|nr:hypothetical protein [Candidatus Lokiarchaeota archaeon]